MGKRALSHDEKRQKQERIVDALEELFVAHAFDEISMARIAEGAQLAKGTLFLYFASKEELFLGLASRRFAEWFPALEAALSEIDLATGEVSVGISAGAVAEAVLASLCGREDLLKLLVILHTRIEAGALPETVHRFRRQLSLGIEAVALHLSRLLPFLSRTAALERARGIYTLVIGVRQLCGPSPGATVSLFRADFTDTFRRMCEAYLAAPGGSH